MINESIELSYGHISIGNFYIFEIKFLKNIWGIFRCDKKPTVSFFT